MYCDLHMHSTASDGTDTPQDLPALAKAAGLSAFALTDHDTTEGLPACAEASEAVGITFVPGIEVSADPGPATDGQFDCRGTLHILGLFVRHDDEKLAVISERMAAARDERNPAIVERLRALGVAIEYAEVESLAAEQGTRIIGRPHIGQVLIDKGVVGDMAEAFRRFIGRGGPAYERRDRLHPQDAIDAIHHAGGLAVLAHPIQLGLRELSSDLYASYLRRFVASLREMGLDAIEVRHSDHTPAHTSLYQTVAEELGLLASGGSDYHGDRKPVELGSQAVPMAVLEAMQRERTQRSEQAVG